MKPNKQEIAVTGSLPTAGTRMTFDENSIAHIMRLLIDLYSDPERAIIRELATNAIDSHIMAGVQRPIEVTTPSSLSPYLVIKDFGLGLTVDELYNLFGKYGASTKRDTNEATGMLGLGSKSPLTYTNQFTMTAVKDGVRATVSISRDEDGVGNLNVVDTSTTSEANGVEIRIPAKTGNSLEAKAKEFFAYWRPGSVLLNGADPTGHADTIEITPSIRLHANDRYRTSTIVMGNVPYPCEELGHAVLGLPYGHSITATVAIGDVDFAPSREALQMTAKTRRAIDAIVREFKRALVAAVQREVTQAATPWEALRVVRDWRHVLGSNAPASFRWNGRDLPTRIERPHSLVKNSWGGQDKHYTGRMLLVERASYYRRKSGSSQVSALDLDHIVGALFIENYDMANWTPTHKEKTLQWLERQPGNEKIRNFVIFDFPIPGREFIDPARIADWQVIKQEKLPKKQHTASGRIPGSYDVVLAGSGRNTQHKEGMKGDDIDQTKPVFWMHGNIYGTYRVVGVLNNFLTEYSIVCLPENRIEKFKRENPKIKNVQAEIKERAEKAVKGLTLDQKMALAMRDAGETREFVPLKSRGAKILDPDVREAVRIAAIPVDGIIKTREMFQREFDWQTNVVFDSPLDKYSLYNVNVARTNADAVIRYLNAEYPHVKKVSKP